MNSEKLPFGRHKGKTWRELPTAYLRRLQALLWAEQVRRARLGLDPMERDAALYTGPAVEPKETTARGIDS